MSAFTFATPQGRINKVLGEILAHAIPVEVLGITGGQKPVPKNKGDTVVFRRWLPYGATTANINTWGISAGALTHLTQEGVTPPADTLVPNDYTAVLQQYSCLYQVTDKTVDLYEDDVAEEMKRQTGQRIGMVREMVRYGIVRAATNKFYGGTGTTRVTVNGTITLSKLRLITRSLKINHAHFITKILDAAPKIATVPVEASYLVFVSTDAESDIRNLQGFRTTAEYANRKPVSEYEIGSCENFRFIVSPELTAYTNAGAAVGATGMFSTGGANIDVYPFIVVAEDAWSQVALRGMESLDVTWIPPGQKDKNDPLGQRGYVGAKTWMTAVVTNNFWMAVLEAGITATP